MILSIDIFYFKTVNIGGPISLMCKVVLLESNIAFESKLEPRKNIILQTNLAESLGIETALHHIENNKYRNNDISAGHYWPRYENSKNTLRGPHWLLCKYINRI